MERIETVDAPAAPAELFAVVEDLGRYPEWLLREHVLGQSLEYRQDWEDRLMMLRYDAEVWTRFE